MKAMQDTEKEVENIVEKASPAEVADKSTRVYELGYLLIPTISTDEVPAAYGDLKELVSSFGGETISDEMPKMINLAYEMLKVTANVRSKHNTAYFGWIKFYMTPAKVLEMKKKLDFDPKVIRFLILKTVKENTIAAKRFVGRDMLHTKPTPAKKDENEAPVEINKEEIDREIDALIAV